MPIRLRLFASALALGLPTCAASAEDGKLLSYGRHLSQVLVKRRSRGFDSNGAAANSILE